MIMLEILRKGNTNARLTFAKDRTTLKVPDRFSVEDEAKFVGFTKAILAVLREKYELQHTLRGNPISKEDGSLIVLLYNNRNTPIFSFKYENGGMLLYKDITILKESPML